MEQYDWKDTTELFQKLNEECNYLILRNYEELGKINLEESLHDDIDFLCDDYKKMVKVMDAKPRRFYDNKVQYRILLGGRYMKIDIRHVGDNYYDSLWQKEMLENKCWNDEGFFTMNESDYFYSLIYHAILQKPALAEDYRHKLADMARSFGIKADTEKDFLTLLIDAMRRRNYFFYYPEDVTVPNRFYLTPKEMCIGKIGWYLRKIRNFPIRAGSFVINLSLRGYRN